MGAMNKILVLITGAPPAAVAAQHGDYGQMMARAIGAAWSGDYLPVDARSETLPRARPAAVVITGSSASVAERAPWMVAAERWLREAVREGVPVLGVCFGHQLLGTALGGQVTPHPGGREIGTVEVERLVSDPLLAGLGARFACNACHSDTLRVLPPGSVVLARSTHEAHHCVRFGARCYGVQFHPEVDAAVMRMFIDARAEAMRTEGLDPAACRRAVGDGEAGRRLMANFAGLSRNDHANT